MFSISFEICVHYLLIGMVINCRYSKTTQDGMSHAGLIHKYTTHIIQATHTYV